MAADLREIAEYLRGFDEWSTVDSLFYEDGSPKAGLAAYARFFEVASAICGESLDLLFVPSPQEQENGEGKNQEGEASVWLFGDHSAVEFRHAVAYHPLPLVTKSLASECECAVYRLPARCLELSSTRFDYSGARERSLLWAEVEFAGSAKAHLVAKGDNAGRLLEVVRRLHPQ